MIEALGVGVLLLFLFGRKAEVEVQPPPTPSGSTGDHTPPTQGPPAAGLLGTLGSLAGLIIKAAVVPGTVAPAVVVTAGTAALSSTLGVLSVLLLANPVAWAIYILIGTIISKHQSESKNFDLAVARLGANARGLHEYERALWDEFEKNTTQTFTRKEVRDGRLDYVFNNAGARVVFNGWRTCVRPATAPPPPPSSTPQAERAGYLKAHGLFFGSDLDQLFRRIRAAALVYLAERARLGTAIRVNKLLKPTTPEGYALNAFALARQYELLEPGLGGLTQVPLLNGAVVAWDGRVDEAEPFPPVDQLIGANTEPNTAELTMADVHSARVAALLDAVCAFRFDLTIDLRGPGDWADNLFTWLGGPAGITRAGRTWTLDRTIFGAEYVIDVWAAKTGTGRIITGAA